MSAGDDEIGELRAQLREHLSLLSSVGRDPLIGAAWGPGVVRLDEVLRDLVDDAGLPDIPDTPWTMTERLRVDEACRRAGLIVGPPLLPDNPR